MAGDEGPLPAIPSSLAAISAAIGYLSWPHESAEEADLYPTLNRLLGGTGPTAAMSRAHAEIARLMAPARPPP
jgi:hemerythrin HHE cation binding domain-containing protein